MRRIFFDYKGECVADDGLSVGKIVAVGGGQHIHLSTVLRARTGDSVAVCGGDGFMYGSKIESISKQKTVLKIIDACKDEAEPSINVTLFFAIQKGDSNDFTVQKCVELGVSALIPVKTKFCVKQNINIDRLNKIAFSAAVQSGRGVVPTVFEPINLSEIFDKLPNFDLFVLPYEKADKPTLKEFLDKNLGKETKSVAVLIGPEGGFCKSEIDAFLDAKIIPISMGKIIMRAETACIAAMTAVMYQSQNL